MADDNNKPGQARKGEAPTRLQPEQWILLISLLLLVGLVITALIPVETPDGKVVVQQRSPSQRSSAAVNRTDVPAQGQTVAALQPFNTVPTHRYQGRVDQVIDRSPGSWGQIHILVRDSAGMQQEISLAPVWYLEFQGCFLKVGQQVDGEAFRFGYTQRPGSDYDYARNVNVNGVRCRLRTLQGVSLWADQLQ
jgi:hypothetical protein